MDMFFFILLSLSPGFFGLFIGLSSAGFGNVSIIFLIASIFAALFGLLGFRFCVIVALRKLDSSHFKLSKRIAMHFSTGEKTIIFEKNGKWKCSQFKMIVTFDLTGIAFKKAFLLAFVTRALRYPKISGQMPVACIGHYRLNGLNKSLTALVEFKSRRRAKRFLLANNGISRATILSWLMIVVLAPSKKSYRFWNTSQDGSVTTYYNEELFCEPYKKNGLK